MATDADGNYIPDDEDYSNEGRYSTPPADAPYAGSTDKQVLNSDAGYGDAPYAGSEDKRALYSDAGYGDFATAIQYASEAITGGGADYSHEGNNYKTPKGEVSTAQTASNWVSDIFKSITGGDKKNNMKLLELGLGAVGGAFKDEQVKKAAALKREQQLQDQDTFNKSITGMRKARPGIIQSALTRTNGQQVFNADGTQRI
jgi:hypothetical protein